MRFLKHDKENMSPLEINLLRIMRIVLNYCDNDGKKDSF